MVECNACKILALLLSLIAAAGCFIVVPALIGAGIKGIVELPWVSAGKIVVWNLQANHWDKTYRSQFAGYQVSVVTEQESNVNLPVSTTDPAFAQTSSKLHKYQPLSYAANVTLTKPTSFDNYLAQAMNVSIDFSYAVPNDTAFYRFAKFDNVNLFKQNEDTTVSQKECTANGGLWTSASSTCHYNYVLTGFCITVNQTSDPWVLSTNYFNHTCRCTYNYGIYDTGAIYSLIPYTDGWTSEIHDFTIPISVRSGDDPYVFAEWLTNGTLDWGAGLSFTSRLARNAALISIGIFLLCPICILYIVSAFLGCCASRNSYNRI